MGFGYPRFGGGSLAPALRVETWQNQISLYIHLSTRAGRALIIPEKFIRVSIPNVTVFLIFEILQLMLNAN